ncbi:hypothetical protein ACFQX7_17650 [Luedemannella flava]
MTPLWHYEAIKDAYPETSSEQFNRSMAVAWSRLHGWMLRRTSRG